MIQWFKECCCVHWWVYDPFEHKVICVKCDKEKELRKD